MKNKIYLAGPDVFSRNSIAAFQHLEDACFKRGLIGIRPSDGGLTDGVCGTKHEISQRIYESNVLLIRQCDGVIANLMPFRGALEPDSGTVFEVGMAIALGKPVAGYLLDSNSSYEEKVSRIFGCGPRDQQGLIFDKQQDMLVEEFDRPLNLMLSCSSSIHETAELALDKLAHALLQPKEQSQRSNHP